MDNKNFITNPISFIDSQDIRKYLYDINYKPNLLQAAFFIYKSNVRSLSDKYAAWKELCERTVDVLLTEEVGWKRYYSGAYGMSVHDLIYEYMRRQKEWMEFFYQEDERAVYCPKYMVRPHWLENDNYSFEYMEDVALFSSFETAQTHAIAEFNKYGDVYESYSICKKFINDEYTNYNDGCADINQSITVYFNRDHEATKFYASGFSLQIDGVEENLGRYPVNIIELVEWEYELRIEDEFFDAMCFSIPVPFKRGDIVIGKPSDWPGGAEPFVLLNVAEVAGCDSSDMDARGWSVGFYKDPTKINNDVMVNLLDLEYYRGEFKGIQRLLPVLALFEAGKIDAWIYQKLTTAIVNESKVDKPIAEAAKEYITDKDIIRMLEGAS